MFKFLELKDSSSAATGRKRMEPWVEGSQQDMNTTRHKVNLEMQKGILKLNRQTPLLQVLEK